MQRILLYDILAACFVGEYDSVFLKTMFWTGKFRINPACGSKRFSLENVSVRPLQRRIFLARLE